MTGQRQRLHRQDRQHARHRVQDQAADKSGEDRDQQRDAVARSRASRRAGKAGIRHGPLRRIHVQRLHRAIGGFQHQHTVQSAANGGGLVGRSDAQHQPVLGKAYLLRRRAFDQAGFGRKERRLHRMRRNQRGCSGINIERLAQRITQLPRGRHWHRSARSGKIFRHRRIGGAVTHFHRQCQGGVFRNAYLFADQEMRRGFQRDCVAGFGISRHGDIGEQPDLTFIAVIHEGADRQAFGCGPLQGIRLPARGQGPINAGGLADIAGIDPIGMPTGADILFQRHSQRTARLGAGLLGDQARLHMRRGIFLRPGRRGESQEQQGGGQELHGLAL